jgi:hypothetical protein
MSSNIHENKINDTRVNPSRVVPINNKWRTWRINIFVYMMIGLILFFGSCAGARAAGWWSTSGRVSVTGEAIKATGADPAEIRGFMTIQEVLTAYNISWEEFSKQFSIPADTDLSSPLNTLEKKAPDFSVTKLRAWLTERAK